MLSTRLRSRLPLYSAVSSMPERLISTTRPRSRTWPAGVIALARRQRQRNDGLVPTGNAARHLERAALAEWRGGNLGHGAEAGGQGGGGADEIERRRIGRQRLVAWRRVEQGACRARQSPQGAGAAPSLTLTKH